MEGEIGFVDVGMADLTEFLIVRVTHRTLGLQRRFILKAKADFCTVAGAAGCAIAPAVTYARQPTGFLAGHPF